MKKISNLLLLCILMLLYPTLSFAYLDPATGSMILQMIVAAVLGSLLTIKIFWKHIKVFFLTKVLKRDNVESNDN